VLVVEQTRPAARALALAVRDAVAPTAEPRLVRLEELNAFLVP